MSGIIRVVVTDDHPVVRAGIRSLLAGVADMEVVGEAGDGLEAVEVAIREHPDVMLMDLQMPRSDGASATARIRAAEPRTQILVLTTYDSDADVLRAVEAGAIGYLLKDAPRDELLGAIRAAASGKSALAPQVASRLVASLGPKGVSSRLTAREVEVLALVAKGATNKEIARLLCVSEATVKTHLLHIFAKLGVDDRTAAVTVAMERGVLRTG